MMCISIINAAQWCWCYTVANRSYDVFEHSYIILSSIRKIKSSHFCFSTS